MKATFKSMLVVGMMILGTATSIANSNASADNGVSKKCNMNIREINHIERGLGMFAHKGCSDFSFLEPQTIAGQGSTGFVFIGVAHLTYGA